MQLQFSRQHLSITSFNEVELPDFAIITGVNGAGKSHLLQAIENNAVTIKDRIDAKIILFNYQSFNVRDMHGVSLSKSEEERANVWKKFSTMQGGGTYLQKMASEVASRHLKTGVLRELELLASVTEKPLFSLTQEDIGDTEAYGQLDAYKSEMVATIPKAKPQGFEPRTISALIQLAQKAKVALHNLTQSKFMELLDLTQSDEVLPAQLSQVFSDYHAKYDLNQYKSYRASEFGEDLEVLTEDEFLKQHGPKPWVVINEIIENFGTLPYRVTSPEGYERTAEFTVELEHQNRSDVKPRFSQLSSGERVLMALVATIYSSRSSTNWPDVLLLDEVDASLHPSMMRNMLWAINESFLKRGMSVVLVSHSPTTIALAPEESIFVMNPSGEDRIVQKSKSEALSILTEGYATLDEGVRLFDQMSKSKVVVVTEGRNTSYIKKMLSFHGEIADVEVLDCISDRTGKSQLKSLYDFFTKVPHQTQVFVVWDSDAKEYKKLVEENLTYPFVFDQNPDNLIAKKGIENLFPAHLFDGFKKTVLDSRGDLVNEDFDTNRKVDFEEFIIERNNPEDFELFLPLVELIKNSCSTSRFG